MNRSFFLLQLKKLADNDIHSLHGLLFADRALVWRMSLLF